MPSNRPDIAQGVAVLAAYQQATAALRARLVAVLTATWRSLGVYRDAQMATFLTEALPVVDGAQQQMASMTVALFAHLGGGVEASVDPAKVTGAAVRNGTPPADVYGRAFHQVWRQIGRGVDVQQAVDSGEKRVEQAAVTDLQRTKALTAQQVLATDPTVQGYQRVLEGAYSCGLCIVASTMRYHKAELLPIHPACDCGIAPVYGAEDLGKVINEGLLADVHAAIESYFGVSDPGGRAIDYRNLIITHEHGELGPVLARASDHFTGPAGI